MAGAGVAGAGAAGAAADANVKTTAVGQAPPPTAVRGWEQNEQELEPKSLNGVSKTHTVRFKLGEHSRRCDVGVHLSLAPTQSSSHKALHPPGQ